MISATKLQEVFLDCLFREEELEGGRPIGGLEWVPCSGIVNNVGFHKERLKAHRDDVKAFLNELNPKFSEGLSFLEMPMDKDGNQWGEQRNAEQLMLLGYGLGYISYPVPRELWKMLPGGVPFVVIDFEKMNGDDGK